MSVGPSGSRPNAVCWVLILAGLLRVSKHTLKHWASVLLATTVWLLEAKRPVGAVEALVDAVRTRATTPLV